MAERRTQKNPRPRKRPGGSSRGVQSVEPGVSGRYGQPADRQRPAPGDDDVIIEESGRNTDPLMTERRGVKNLPAPVPDGSSRLTAPAYTDFSAGDGSHPGVAGQPRLTEILTVLRRQFEATNDLDGDNVREAQIDDEFRNLNQWNAEAAEARRNRGAAALVVDQLTTPILQVVNAHRSSMPSIKVTARGGGATKRLAEIYQDGIRRIEYDSMAGAVYAQAVDSAATNGRGHWMVVVEYAGKTGFDQEMKIRGIRNRYSVYRDPLAQEPDKSDSRWWILTEDVPISDYQELYPFSRAASAVHLSQMGDDVMDGWIDEQYIRVATYWFCLTKQYRRFQLDTGEEVVYEIPTGLSEEEYATLPASGQGLQLDGEDGPVVNVMNHRDEDQLQWYVAKVNAVEILEGNDDRTDAAEWPGRYAPILECVGEEFMVQGRIVQRGLIRRARDGQIMLNTMVTDLVETQAKAPKHLWDGFVGQFGKSTNDPVWKQWVASSNGKLHFVQHVPQFNPKTGELLPKPTLNQYEPPIQNLIVGIQMANQFIKDTTGWHAAALGDQTDARDGTSGRAYEALMRASEQGTSHISANFEIALCHTGRIMVDLYASVYNNRPGRMLHLINMDGDESAVLVKQPFRQGPEGPVPLPEGMPLTLGQDEYVDLARGEFAVAVRPGRSALTKHEEMNQAFAAIIKAMPQAAAILGPRWIRTIDAPGMEAAADTMELMLPEHLRTAKPGQKPPLPPEVMAQMQQMEGMVQALTAALTELQAEQDADAVGAASRERIAALNNRVKLIVEKMKIASTAAAQGRTDGATSVASQLEMTKEFGRQAHERVMQSIQMAGAKVAMPESMGRGV